jgi:hypothetical protein
MILRTKRLELVDYPKVQQIYTSASTKTFQHTPKFISYHGNRYEDLSVMICDGNVPVAFCLAAVEPTNEYIVVSHPGATFGGLILGKGIQGSKLDHILSNLLVYYSNLGFEEFRYKSTPYIYSDKPSDDLLYATYKNGGVQISSLLSCALDLRNPISYSSQRVRGIKKGQQNVGTEFGWRNINYFWEVLIHNLKTRHKSKPLHSLDEINELKEVFNEDIELVVARDKKSEEISAGVVLFKSKNAWKTQYIASGDDGRKIGALDELIHNVIIAAKNAQVKYLDFGTSHEPTSGILSDGLYSFKSGFGGGGVSYNQYRFEL